MRELKINSGALGYLPGSKIMIHCDSSGIPVEQFWRNRIRDAKIDKCVEWAVKPSQAKEFKKPIETKEHKQIKESKKESKK